MKEKIAFVLAYVD